MATEAKRERIDAARSKRRILDAAAEAFAEDPALGMAAVAARAGVARATVHRHYPSRGHLIGALEDELIQSAAEIIDAHAARQDLGPAEALGVIVEDFIDTRYCILFDRQGRFGVSGQTAKRRWDEPLLRLIERGQRAGELATDVRPRVILVALAGLARRALRGYVDGEVTLDEAKLLARRGLLEGFASAANRTT